MTKDYKYVTIDYRRLHSGNVPDKEINKMKIRTIIAGILAGIQCAAMLPLSAMAADSSSLGDLTGNGEAGADDASMILVDAAAIGATGTGLLTEEQKLAADTNHDGYADAADAAVILVYSALAGSGAVSGGLEDYLNKANENLDSIAAPVLAVGKRTNAAIIRWDPVAYASGYEIYRCSGTNLNSANYQLVKTVEGGSISSYLDSLSDNGSYCYKVRAYRNQPNGTIYSDFSNARDNWTKEAILQGVDLEPHNTITVYNKQGASTTSYDVTLSENDIAILDKFAMEHFPENCTREDQLWITLQWIHKNVDYAYVGEKWNAIQGLSWVEAIFEKQSGQCVQYNGALAAMMVHIGYDASMVQGYRGTYPSNYWQHFWPEVEIDGKTYMMECGNYGKSGDWYYFLCTYDETSKYICNQKAMG